MSLIEKMNFIFFFSYLYRYGNSLTNYGIKDANLFGEREFSNTFYNLYKTSTIDFF